MAVQPVRLRAALVTGVGVRRIPCVVLLPRFFFAIVEEEIGVPDDNPTSEPTRQKAGYKQLHRHADLKPQVAATDVVRDENTC